PVEPVNEPRSFRVAADRKDNWYRRRRGFQRQCRWSGSRNNHVHLTADQLSRQCRQSVILLVGPEILDPDVPALDKAGFAEALPECCDHRLIAARRRAAEQTDHRHRRLLRTRRERRARDRATEQHDEFAAPHHKILFARLPKTPVAGAMLTQEFRRAGPISSARLLDRLRRRLDRAAAMAAAADPD